MGRMDIIGIMPPGSKRGQNEVGVGLAEMLFWHFWLGASWNGVEVSYRLSVPFE